MPIFFNCPGNVSRATFTSAITNSFVEIQYFSVSEYIFWYLFPILHFFEIFFKKNTSHVIGFFVNRLIYLLYFFSPGIHQFILSVKGVQNLIRSCSDVKAHKILRVCFRAEWENKIKRFLITNSFF